MATNSFSLDGKKLAILLNTLPKKPVKDELVNRKQDASVNGVNGT